MPVEIVEMLLRVQRRVGADPIDDRGQLAILRSEIQAAILHASRRMESTASPTGIATSTDFVTTTSKISPTDDVSPL